MSTSDPRPTKNQRRAEAREKARRLREEQKKREKRNRMLWQGGIAVGVLAVLAIVALVIVNSVRPAGPGPKNMLSDGIIIGKDFKAVRTAAIPSGGKPVATDPKSSGDALRIVTYVDYLCPYCGEFERANDAQIGKLVEQGAATVEIHPIPLLQNGSQGTKYSLRAANAAACVANFDPDRFWKLNTLLFANQPDEQSAGLTDEQIKKFVKKSGVTGAKYDKVTTCMEQGTFKDWAQDALQRWRDKPIPNSDFGKNKSDQKGTPIIVVNGQTYRGSLTDTSAFRSFLLQVQSKGSTDGSTQSPAPSETPEPRSTGSAG